MRFNSFLNPGFTLIEILVTIVLISIVGTTVMRIFTNTSVQSAKPVIQQQALAIAEAYMEEIRGQSFCEDITDCATSEDVSGSEEGTSRDQFDDVLDYRVIATDTVVKDQNGTAIGSLSDYEVMVSITPNATLGSLTADANVIRIDVSVDHAAIDPIALSGFKVNYQ